jgi:thymidylate kinase
MARKGKKIYSVEREKNFRYEKLGFQTKVRDMFEGSLYDPEYWVGLDGTKTVDEIFEDIRENVLRVSSDLKEGDGFGKVGKLWSEGFY